MEVVFIPVSVFVVSRHVRYDFLYSHYSLIFIYFLFTALNTPYFLYRIDTRQRCLDAPHLHHARGCSLVNAPVQELHEVAHHEEYSKKNHCIKES
ncbi:hypothetical protein JYU34_009589 [Plutella xylostella]|uniref:Uncharacterized protein n=1 Tax=Plutella xylostella TaxID=51655 RepID=A0ABQ7QK30_PLUXY|nr:hypothetical protein JYU34_009589 [Plutella xylostella]